jgi:hypothetical protein
MMPLIRSSKPAVWESRWRIVTAWSNVRGSGKSRYRPMSASRSIFPCSTSCITAVATNTFETDPTRKSVRSGSTGRGAVPSEPESA